MRPLVEVALERVRRLDANTSRKAWSISPTATLPLDSHNLFLKTYALLSSLKVSEDPTISSNNSEALASSTHQSTQQTDQVEQVQGLSTTQMLASKAQTAQCVSSTDGPESEITPNTVDQAVFRIVSMGFTPTDARRALSRTDSGTSLRVDAAIQLLIDQIQGPQLFF